MFTPNPELEQFIATPTDTGRYYIKPQSSESYPSVTTYLVNTSENMWFNNYRKRNPKSLQNAGVRGQAVHDAVEGYYKGMPCLPENIAYPYFNQLLPFLKIFKPHFMEALLVSRKWGVAGRCDAGGIVNNKCVMVDWKSKGRDSSDLYDYPLQLAAYVGMFEECYPDYAFRIDMGILVVVTPTKIKLVPYDRDQISFYQAEFLKRVKKFNEKFGVKAS
jgi:genome maintenance exonuclease 1